MKILPINYKYNTLQNTDYLSIDNNKERNDSNFKRENSCQTLAFSDKPDFLQNNSSKKNLNLSLIYFTGKQNLPVKNKMYDIFMKKYKETFGTLPLENVITDTIKSGKLIGCGRFKKVYEIPDMPEYLVGYLYRSNSTEPMTKVVPFSDKLSEYNFGQPIAGNNKAIIMKKLDGVPCGIEDYPSVAHFIAENRYVTREMALQYLSKLRLMKNFPQSAYNELAEQTKYIADKGYFLDFINPNNMLIDTKNQRFHHIDLSSQDEKSLLINEILKASRKYNGQSGLYDIVHLILDAKFQSYYLDQLLPAERQETVNITKSILKKCMQAASEVKIYKEDNLTTDVINNFPLFNRNFPVSRYAEFKEEYKDIENLYM